MIDSETNPYSMITIKGKVIEQTTDGANRHIDNLAKNILALRHILLIQQILKG